MQRFWPLPLTGLWALVVPEGSEMLTGGIAMPDWWPLVKPAGNLENMLFALLPVLAALGYSDVAIANSPQEKGRHSALLLAVYSISLLGLSIVASHYRHLAIIPALFAPVAHEFTIVLGQNRELNGKPIYIHPEKGIMVLETIKGSIGSKMGLNTRDIILSINGMEVNNKCQVTEAVAIHGWWTEMEYRDSKTGEIKQRFTRKKVGEPLGIIFVPGPGDVANVKFNPDNSFISRIWPHKKDCQQSSTP